MSEKDFSLSVGVRGTLLGYDAAAAYNRQHGVNCFQGQVSVNSGANGFISLLDEDLSKKLRAVLPEFLSCVNADVSFSFGYDHSLFSVDTDTLKFTAISLKNERGEATGSGFLCEVSDGKSSGIVAEIIKTAKDFIGIDNFYLYISNGRQPVDIGRLLNPFDKKDTISPPAKLFNGGFCLYSRYEFSESRGGVLDKFLGELLGIKSLAFFAGKDAENAAYFALSLPQLTNEILSVEDLILKFAKGKTDICYEVSGTLSLSAIPQTRFALDCTLSPDRVMLSAAVVSKNFVNLIGDFYVGDVVLSIGYDKGLTFGILGEMQLRKLFLFGAVQLTYSGVLNVQLISLATGKLTISSLVENITGLYISQLNALDSILCVDYFKIDFAKKFQIEWLKNGDMPRIVSFFNDNIKSEQLSLHNDYVEVKKEPQDDGYYLTDKFRMRHYYVDGSGNLALRPQFYYSNVAEPFELANGMVVSAGIFFCAEIRVFEIISLKALFSFRPNEGALAFGMLSEIDLGIIKISSSDFGEENPIPLPENSVLKQFLDISSKGVAFYFQTSANETSFYFDGMISIAGLLKCQARLFYQKGLISVNAESTLCGMTTKISLSADYRSFKSASFLIALSFDIYKLEETLAAVKNRLTRAIEVCREKINNANRSLEDAKNKVRKLYGEINVLNGRINDCRNRLSRMSWWEKIFAAPIIGCEIAGLEIAKGAIYAAIAVAEAALTVAQAAIKFAGTLGEGVLKLVNGIIDSVTSLFFIRKLEAVLLADVNELYMRLGIEFVALGKEYSYSWSVEKKIMGSTEQGRAALSHAMINKMEPDVSDLENGVVSGARLMNKYANVKAYFEQPAKISDAAAVLERNAEMTRFIQNKYVEEFGEELPDFDEMNARLLENIGVIKANIDVAERSAALSEMKDTVDKLREISEISNGSDCETAAEAVEKYDKAVELSGEMRELLERLDETRDAICSIRDDRRLNARKAVKSRGIYGEQYRGSMYEYAKSVREMLELTYKDLPPNGYINLWDDEQIRETVLQAEEYFRTNG